MRLLNQMLNLSRIFDCFSRRFNKVVFNLKLLNSVDSHVPSQSIFYIPVTFISIYHIMFVAVCSSKSLATRRATRNLIYILPLFFLIFLQLLLTQKLSQFCQLLHSSLLLLFSLLLLL